MRRIVRLYIEKSSVKSEYVEDLAKNLRSVFQEYLLGIHKKAFSELEADPIKLQAYVDLFPEFSLSNYELPSDDELHELVQSESFEGEDGTVGWKYSVLDEPNCVSGSLEIYAKNYTPQSLGASWNAMGLNYGFKISEEVVKE